MTKDSRLERFLKALCSLEYSDLPTPLSRVEVLWSCLVTGETAPDFQPQSRTEKYLMSILGVYDLEGIPQPISKAEMLLYKLATGDTNVELGGGAKSRYEELLAEIVGKGEIGYTDFYYTTHTLTESLNTLYNTAEAPVKSAILKGNTKLVDEMGNICDELNTPNTIRGAYISEDTGQEILAEASFNTSFIKCPTVSFSVIGENRYKRVIFFDKNKEFILGLNSPYDDNKTFTVAMSEIPTNAIYMRISASLSLKDGVTYKPNQKIFIEDTNGNNLYLTNLSSVKMPVLKTTGKNLANKSNILTVNEPVELRGIGDVKDELNLLTGELTERVGEVVLDSSEGGWINTYYSTTDTICYDVSVTKKGKVYDQSSSKGLISDKLPSRNWIHFYGSKTNEEGIVLNRDAGLTLHLKISKNKLTSADYDGVRSYLQRNPITVQYQLEEESVKTVDLSTLDQDGNNTKLSTFNDVTHVSLSSEGPIPEAEMMVATKNPDDISQASTMSLRMNDISDRQNELQNEVDTQSENIDSTMMATTEIYEQTL